MEYFTPATLIGFLPVLIALAGLGGAWFQARYGRKVRLKVGDIEVEGQTMKQIEKLLLAARHRNNAAAKARTAPTPESAELF